MSRNVGLFPGQGSQTVGMGKSAFDTSELAREVFDRADTTLGFALSKLCFEGPIEELTLTQNAQPAILTVSYICFELAQTSLIAAAGHSLGEFSALVASGTLRFEDALQLVYKRGRYMQEAVAPGLGAMAAVMGPDEATIQEALKQVEGIVEIANLNCPGQTVIAGETQAISEASEKLQAGGAKVIPLNVSAPFHSSMMQPAADKLQADLRSTTFDDPTFPVYANITAQAVTTGEEARKLLFEQVTGSVRWTESIQNIVSQCSPDLFIEFGNGDVLAKLLKRIDKSVAKANVSDLASAQALVS